MANSPGTGGKSAARLKKRNETKMILRQPVLLIAVLATIALLVLFVIFPLAKVLLFSVTDESGAVSLASLKQLFTTTRYLKTFGRTMALGVVVAVISTFIGYIFAFTITRTNVPCKGFLKTIATLPILSPPFILSLSIIFLFGKRCHLLFHLFLFLVRKQTDSLLLCGYGLKISLSLLVLFSNFPPHQRIDFRTCQFFENFRFFHRKRGKGHV